MTELCAETELLPPIIEDREERLRVQRRRLQHPSSRVRTEAATELSALGADALPALQDALNDSHVDVRVAAVGSLERIGTSQAVEVLATALDDGEWEVRSNAAAALTDLDAAPSVNALCIALKHKDGATRIAAAKALGALGDARAISALLEAYRRCFVSGSAGRQFLLGLMVAAALVLCTAAFLWGTFAGKVGGLVGCLNIFVQIGNAYFRKRQEHSQVAAAISEALLRIAERSADPEIHRIVPELRAVTHDRLQHTRETRTAARKTADRIETLTARLQTLPVASHPAESPLDATLPRPAGDPALEARNAS